MAAWRCAVVVEDTAWAAIAAASLHALPMCGAGVAELGERAGAGDAKDDMVVTRKNSTGSLVDLETLAAVNCSR